MSTHRTVVLGASGFVGSAILRALRQRPDTTVVGCPAPRLTSSARTVAALAAEAAESSAGGHLGAAFTGADVVVNAAGIADAAMTDLDRLTGANALLPLAALLAADAAGVPRFVHVSSTAVQGRLEPLDESPRRQPCSAYAASKGLGEESLLAARVSSRLVVYRPTSVHGTGRGVTRRLAALARSPISSVAGVGTRPTPQVLVDNVAAAVAHLCFAERPARIVLHPWEGLTTGEVMTIFGAGRHPLHLPERLARLTVRCADAGLGRVLGRRAEVRRVEMLWFGQAQAGSWLTGDGWRPPIGRDGWIELAETLRKERA